MVVFSSNNENKKLDISIMINPNITNGFSPYLSESLPLKLAVIDIPNAPGNIISPALSGEIPFNN